MESGRADVANQEVLADGSVAGVDSVDDINFERECFVAQRDDEYLAVAFAGELAGFGGKREVGSCSGTEVVVAAEREFVGESFGRGGNKIQGGRKRAASSSVMRPDSGWKERTRRMEELEIVQRCSPLRAWARKEGVKEEAAARRAPLRRSVLLVGRWGSRMGHGCGAAFTSRVTRGNAITTLAGDVLVTRVDDARAICSNTSHEAPMKGHNGVTEIGEGCRLRDFFEGALDAVGNCRGASSRL